MGDDVRLVVKSDAEAAVQHAVMLGRAGRVCDGGFALDDAHDLLPRSFPLPLLVLVADQQHITGGPALALCVIQRSQKLLFLRAAALAQHEDHDGILALVGFCFCGGQGGMEGGLPLLQGELLFNPAAGFLIQHVGIDFLRLAVAGGELYHAPVRHVHPIQNKSGTVRAFLNVAVGAGFQRASVVDFLLVDFPGLDVVALFPVNEVVEVIRFQLVQRDAQLPLALRLQHHAQRQVFLVVVGADDASLHGAAGGAALILRRGISGCFFCQVPGVEGRFEGAR